MATEDFVPALRFRVLTRWYDRILRCTTREKRFKRALIVRVSLPPEGTLLDVGCGTGTMTWWIHAQWPAATVIGIDADPDALAIARKKRGSKPDQVIFIETLAQATGLASDSVDVAISSLFFHHLTDDNKKRVLREVARVLRPNGQFLVADWGRSRSAWLRWAFVLVRCLDGFPQTQSNARGRLPSMIEDAGFAAPRLFDGVPTAFGEIYLWETRRL